MNRSDDSPLPPFTSPLYTFEAEWVNRYRFLNDCGYQLRPRYVPNRAPDWAAKGADAVHCEDAIPAPVVSLYQPEILLILSILIAASASYGRHSEQ